MSLAQNQNNGQPRRWERSRAYRDNSLSPKPESRFALQCLPCASRVTRTSEVSSEQSVPYSQSRVRKHVALVAADFVDAFVTMEPGRNCISEQYLNCDDTLVSRCEWIFRPDCSRSDSWTTTRQCIVPLSSYS